MGQKHRERRAAYKLIVGDGLKKGGLDMPVKVALKILKGGISATTLLGFKVADLGYRENEFGELRSTIRRLTEREILDRMQAKAVFEIQWIEDQHVFSSFGASISRTTLEITLP
jgi:hypothetical protein